MVQLLNNRKVYKHIFYSKSAADRFLNLVFRNENMTKYDCQWADYISSQRHLTPSEY